VSPGRLGQRDLLTHDGPQGAVGEARADRRLDAGHLALWRVPQGHAEDGRIAGHGLARVDLHGAPVADDHDAPAEGKHPEVPIEVDVYEWFAHAPIGQREGLPDDVIERVRARGDLSILPARYVRPARLVQHVLAFESIPAALQEEVQRELGMPGLIELVVLVGHYRQIGGVLSAFDVALPDGARAPF
jgi:hypothetical protein